MPKQKHDFDELEKKHGKRKAYLNKAYAATTTYGQHMAAGVPQIPDSEFEKNRIKRPHETEANLAKYGKPGHDFTLEEYEALGIADEAPKHLKKAAVIPQIAAAAAVAAVEAVKAAPVAKALAPAAKPGPKKRLVKNADKPKAKKPKKESKEKPTATAHQRNKVTIRPASSSKKLVITIKPQ
jgi:hypothetical protein